MCCPAYLARLHLGAAKPDCVNSSTVGKVEYLALDFELYNEQHEWKFSTSSCCRILKFSKPALHKVMINLGSDYLGC